MKKLDEASIEIKNRRKKRAIKVAITEGLMVVAVILMVAVTTLLAIGYNVNPKEGTVERAGLVQIQSIPSGANVVLDGDAIFGWTNLSRSMNEGEHEIVISRDGYDSWSKKILVTAGLYYRLNYPRLFLAERKTEEIADFAKMKFVSFAKDGNLMLAVPNESSKWQLWKINEDKPTMTEIDTQKAFSGVDLADAKVKAWSGNSEKVLLTSQGKWLMLDVKHPEESVNLTEKFGFEFSKIKIANDAASELFALENGNLRTIDVDESKISGVLVPNVNNFDNLKTDLVYVTNQNEKGEFQTGIYRKGEKGSTILSEMLDSDSKEDTKVLVTLGEYFGEYYVIENVTHQIGVYRSEKLPSYGDETEMSAVSVEEIGFVPEKLETTGGGGLFTAVLGNERATFDVEAMGIEKNMFETKVEWLDEHMLYTVEDGKLCVMDFDGANKREIVSGAKDGTEVKISKNNRWMYYLSQDLKLKRVVIGN